MPTWRERWEFFYTGVFQELAQLTFPMEDDIEDVVDCPPSGLTKERKPLIPLPFHVEDLFPSMAYEAPFSADDEDDISEEEEEGDDKPFLSWDKKAGSSVHKVISAHGTRFLNTLSRQPPPFKKARKV